ncbi:hypothetical protein PgNI_11177 [Pyricularia grisea]|uniref:Asl1-like glycosyl hydrolase catalytic domain-containing protein n=1 Tax=Pyricularia grisea TaxID=148305 RepID=A0A6P8AQ09_PYRGI|nr:hypothetical protein PgNI_11177 [Pyricularia grisea]TLD04134.1 hypothetical protein PgNI_11177 [Pyricularia grisea]
MAPSKKSKKQRAAKLSSKARDEASIGEPATQSFGQAPAENSSESKTATVVTISDTEESDTQVNVQEENPTDEIAEETPTAQETSQGPSNAAPTVLYHSTAPIPTQLLSVVENGGTLHRAVVDIPNLPIDPEARKVTIEKLANSVRQFSSLVKFIDESAMKKQELDRLTKLEEASKIESPQRRELIKLYATAWPKGFMQFLVNALLLGVVVQETSAAALGSAFGLVLLTNIVAVGFFKQSACTATAMLDAKRGLAFNDGVDISGFSHSAMINWGYNWYSDTWQTTNEIEFGPMLWGIKMELPDVFSPNAWKWVDSGDQLSGVKTTHVLSFNEPDHPAQANMDVGTAIAWHQYYFEQFIGRALIGSPAVTNGGYEWLNTFLYNCDLHEACHVDFVAVHWYNKAAYVDDFKNWIDRVCTLAHPRKVWLTEFQGLGTEEEMISFLREVLPWLDANNCVERYAYFGITTNDHHMLVGAGPELSLIGEIYAGFRN